VRAPWQRARRDADVSLARAGLTAQEFERAFEQGGRLSVEEMLAQAGKSRGPRRRPPSGWSSLTEAERQVAALVAEGLTNREIAERLFISVSTVKSHLSHTFAKLGLSRRSELAREASLRPADASQDATAGRG
jgi:DNA-binding CsgD family transcriptional regulator